MFQYYMVAQEMMLMFQYYKEAQEICCQVYGEVSLLSSRLYINIGIVHEHAYV